MISKDDKDYYDSVGRSIVAGSAILLALIIANMAIGPVYKVYQYEQAGIAALKNAEYSKKVKVEEAKADLDSATLYAQAEVERAKGVAEANKIIGDSLKGNDAYLRYLWIQGLQTNDQQIVYIPTEAGLPILEATRGSMGGFDSE